MQGNYILTSLQAAREEPIKKNLRINNNTIIIIITIILHSGP